MFERSEEVMALIFDNFAKSAHFWGPISKKCYSGDSTVKDTNLVITKISLLSATNYHYFQYVQTSCLKGEKSK